MGHFYEHDWPSTPGEFVELELEPAPVPQAMTEAEADELASECADLDEWHAQLTANLN